MNYNDLRMTASSVAFVESHSSETVRPLLPFSDWNGPVGKQRDGGHREKGVSAEKELPPPLPGQPWSRASPRVLPGFAVSDTHVGRAPEDRRSHLQAPVYEHRLHLASAVRSQGAFIRVPPEQT